MFSTLRNRFGIPGVISVIALVFAMFGGAYAASNSSGGGKATASTKAKKGPRGPKGATGPAGPAGPQGPAGPAGPAGAKGDNGAAGANGTNGAPGAPGAAGKSVTTASEAPFGECGEQEGVKLTSASGTSYVCDGAEGAKGDPGSPWVAGTAPSDVVMKGTWSAHGTAVTAGEEIPVAVSFTVPVGGEVAAILVGPGNPSTQTICNGTADAPAPGEVEGTHFNGTVCLYEKTSSNLNEEAFSWVTGTSSGGGLVAALSAKKSGLYDAYGSWAMYTP
jgi:hypothetical protein